MKIQTQARLLIASIVLVPLLIVCTYIAYRRIFIVDDVYGLPTYGDISVLLDENINFHGWEPVTRLAVLFRNRGEIAIFRDDHLILYSTIPEFTPGVFTTRETVVSMFDDESRKAASTVALASLVLEEHRVYVLSRVASPPSRSHWLPFFFPLFLVFVFVVLLIIFAFCMSIVITQTITRSVRVLENATRRIADGELDLSVDVRGSNEITSLTNSLNKMRNTLKEEELRRSRFIMGVTHDLKTPLALIKGYAEAIKDGIVEDPVSSANATGIIIEKSDQLEEMINDLLDFVRMETGEWRTQLKQLNLSAFLGKMAGALGSDVELLRHTLTHDINLPEDIAVPMDERLALRAFENLVHNAVRHTPAGSAIRIAAVHLDNAVELIVSDNGPGIDGEALPHIFDMFYRGTSSRRERGLGLGLAVVKWVADYHGWTISVASEKGVGTCFLITIPCDVLGMKNAGTDGP